MSKPRNTLGALLDRGRKIIASEGLLVVATGRPHVVAYSIGLTTRLGYEVFVVGLPPDVALPIVNALAARLKAAEEPDDTPLEEIANMPLRLRFLSRKDSVNATRRLRMIPALGYEPQRIRQLLFPDPQGRFPGEDGYSMSFDQTLDDAGV